MKHIFSVLLAVTLLISCTACTPEKNGKTDLNKEPKPASKYTAQMNSAVYSLLDFDDKQESEFAVRGLIDAPETLELTDDDGKMIRVIFTRKDRIHDLTNYDQRRITGVIIYIF